MIGRRNKEWRDVRLDKVTRQTARLDRRYRASVLRSKRAFWSLVMSFRRVTSVLSISSLLTRALLNKESRTT